MVMLPKPGSGADSSQISAFVHNQLDRIALGLSDGRPFPILYGLVLQGCGPRDRMQGGVFLKFRLKSNSNALLVALLHSLHVCMY